jgi:hypothetical protein
MQPGKLRVEGSQATAPHFSLHFIFVIDGDSVWERWSVKELNGPALRANTPRFALLKTDGLACGVGSRLPGILLDMHWSNETAFYPNGRYLPAFASRALLDGKDVIADHPCYRVVCEREITTWTFWVDKYNYLLRRVRQDASPEQTAVQRQYGGGGATGRILSDSLTENYSIEQLDGELDPELFRAPDENKGDRSR